MNSRTEYRAPRGELLDRVTWIHVALLLAIQWTWIAVGAAFPGWWFLVEIAATIPIALGLSFGLRALERWIAQVAIGTLAATVADRPPPSYSVEEALVARGAFDRAADALLTRILASPDEIEAYFRLAEVHSRHRRDFAAAEQVYRDLRARHLRPRDARRLDGALVDLYESAGDVGRLKAELSRYADQYRGTAAGAGAARRLQELREG